MWLEVTLSRQRCNAPSFSFKKLNFISIDDEHQLMEARLSHPQNSALSVVAKIAIRYRLRLDGILGQIFSSKDDIQTRR